MLSEMTLDESGTAHNTFGDDMEMKDGGDDSDDELAAAPHGVIGHTKVAKHSVRIMAAVRGSADSEAAFKAREHRPAGR